MQPVSDWVSAAGHAPAHQTCWLTGNHRDAVLTCHLFEHGKVTQVLSYILIFYIIDSILFIFNIFFPKKT